MTTSDIMIHIQLYIQQYFCFFFSGIEKISNVLRLLSQSKKEKFYFFMDTDCIQFNTIAASPNQHSLFHQGGVWSLQ